MDKEVLEKHISEYLSIDELDKCILVCSNSHREIHGQLYNGK